MVRYCTLLPDVWVVGFSPDAPILVSASADLIDRTVRLWPVGDLEQIVCFAEVSDQQ